MQFSQKMLKTLDMSFIEQCCLCVILCVGCYR